MKTSISSRISPVAAFAAVCIASPLAGQGLPAQPSTTASISRIEGVASDVEDRALWAARARRLATLADSLPIGDADALDGLRRAALIQIHIGEPRVALELMIRAADDASATGDVVTAAHAMIDAAWIASGTRRSTEAHNLVERALLLARSPLLTEADRAGIRGRVAPGAVEVASLR